MQYRRVLIKLSGELLGSIEDSVDVVWISRIVKEVSSAVDRGVQVAIVVGGGNMIRGASLSDQGVGRLSADTAGMLATVINGVVLADMFEQNHMPCEVMSALPMPGLAEPFNAKKACQLLEKGTVVIFAGGTGNPLVTTDSAASLRAVEIGAELLLKATRVDGVYDRDPLEEAMANKFDKISFNDVIAKELRVMDMGAFIQCQQYSLPIFVFDVNKPNALLDVLRGSGEGTLIS
ncbi:UMP kinase [Candidatus Synchoanobacter obligatus]|uniref:Uridylate kinase n=1 Tax=Candidatus Synchoanobacter obligatus TaxID=2919597 RepID=A0ABT1L4J1_9GAMM|nr:UMP kinase [Candidatus Synchoanobacter obligatus]MCP8352094.1 UMP kinase [Candidatus Synchoanobacter obligatus]